MNDTFVYKFGADQYINLTNRCTNDCDFCIRRGGDGISGYDLWLNEEPTSEMVLEQLTKPGDIVFCGYGEPTCALQVLLEVAGAAKAEGRHVRLNTNGHGSEYNGANIAPLLASCVDTVSISLNMPDAESYDRICHSIYGCRAFDIMLQFGEQCITAGIATIFSVVDIIGDENVEKCKKIAEQLGAQFRVRAMIE